MMEKIRFVDYVCNAIEEGNFISASTACNYLVYGRVQAGQRASAMDEHGFDKDDFMLDIEPRLIGSKKVFLSRRMGLFQFRCLDLSKEDKAKLYKAWQVAASIQTERNRIADEEHAKEREAAHWWP